LFLFVLFFVFGTFFYLISELVGRNVLFSKTWCSG